MNSNKFFNIIAVSISLLSITIMGTFCVITGIRYQEKSKSDLLINENEYDLILKGKYEIRKGNFNKYEKKNGTYTSLDDQVIDYSGEVADGITIGSEIHKGETIAFNGVNDIFASDDGVVIDVSSSGFSVYYFNRIEFTVNLSSEEYYETTLRNDYYCSINGTYYNLSLERYNLSQASSNGNFLAVFSTNSLSQIVTPVSFDGIYRLTKTYEDSFYISSKPFIENNSDSSYFAYFVNETFYYCYVHCIDVIGESAIIDTIGADLSTIDYLYDFE